MTATRIITLKALGAATTLAIAGQAAASDCAVFDALDTPEAPEAQESATCATYLTKTAATGVSCHWEFPYRSDVAHRFFETVWANLQTCRPGVLRETGNRVNHPDSYDLREWVAQSGVYAVSKKDKAAAERTLVFLRFEPRD